MPKPPNLPQLPAVELPDINLPDIDLPDVKLPDIELPDLNVRFPDININTDLGIFNVKGQRSDLRRQQGGARNRQGSPGGTGIAEGQGSFEEVLKHLPDQD